MFSKDYLNEGAKYELNKIVEIENKLDKSYLSCKTGNKKNNKVYNFQKFKTVTSSGREIHNNDLSLDDSFEQQIKSKNDIDIFKDSIRPKKSFKK